MRYFRPGEKLVVAYHEIGHALVAAMQTHSAPVQKITIIPRTSGALGYTMQVEQGDKYLMTKKRLRIRLLHLPEDVQQRKLFWTDYHRSIQ